MKQLIFFLLFPCFAMAQYQGNGNQKITLGEQTTADGLVFRGVAADTTLTVKSDTAAYFVLDTVNLNLYTYKASASGRKWRQLGADTAAIAYVNTYGTQTVNGAKTFTSELTATRFNPTANTETGTGMFLPAANTLGFSTNGTEKVRITSGGNLGLGTNSVAEKLTVNGKGLFENNSNAAQQLIIKNTTAGSNSEAYLYLISDITAGSTTLGKFSSTTTPFKIIGASNAYWFNGIAGDIAIINNYGSGAIKMSAGGSSTAQLTLNASGNVGIGTESPNARLHLAAGTATASTAPLKFTSGTNLTTAEAGAMEFNGTNLFFSPSTTRHTVNHGLTGSATLDFPSTTTLLSADLTITVTGAADGDVVSLGVPNTSVNANTFYTAWVSATNTVTVRFNNYSSGTVNPASGTFKVFVTK